MNRRDYCLHLNTEQGSTCVQVNVEKGGEINIDISSDKPWDENDPELRYSIRFKSDTDVKGLIELLRWSRKASLEAQGYKVVM